MILIEDVLNLLPTIFLVCWSLILLLVDLWIPKQKKWLTASLAVTGLVFSSVLFFIETGNTTAFNDMVIVDGFSRFLSIFFLVSGIVAVFLAHDYLKRMEIERGEYYSLLLFSISGMMLMSNAQDMIIVFLALELLSIPLYILAGFYKRRLESEEAGLKYFLLGAFSSGIFIYGVSLLFASTGYTSFEGIYDAIKNGLTDPVLLMVGAALVLIGFSFKAAIVPFHMWTPDVYEGAPTPITAFMSVGVKAAAFAAIMRIFMTMFSAVQDTLVPVLWVLAVITMLGGNVIAISQKNIKRLLAYSGIAHAGYLLMAFVPYGNANANQGIVSAILFYLVAYGLTTFGAWAVVISLEMKEGAGLKIDDYAGLGRRYPILAVPMMIFMLSYTGVPLTLGFLGKLYLFTEVIQGGYIVLAIIGLLASLISAYYYLRIIVVMFMQDGEPVIRKNTTLGTISLIMAGAVVILSFVPGVFLNIVDNVILSLW